MHIYWPTSFILPKACIAQLEWHTRNFFWGHFNDSRKLKPVAWSKICSPIESEGLGISSISAVASATVLRQVWFIVSNRSCLWISWVYKKYIKHRSFWDLKTPSNCSLGWRGILNSRKEALRHVTHLIGNGNQTKFWLHLWLPCGRLIDVFGTRRVYDLGYKNQINVSSFISNGNWNFPIATSAHLIDIFKLITESPTPCIDCDDEIIWATSDCGSLNLKSILVSKQTQQNVSWWEMMWFEGRINKFYICICKLSQNKRISGF